MTHGNRSAYDRLVGLDADQEEESMNEISRQCAEGLHNFCKGDAASCACSTCHLGPCDGCGAGNLQRVYGTNSATLCASCYRGAVFAAPKETQPCDGCGARNAFRNPVHRRNEYLCASCHAASGESVVIAGGAARVAAPCAGLDVDDERHVWVHVRGSRFQCRCGTKRYDDVLRARRRRELENELF